VKDELVDFYRLIAMLQNNLFSNNSEPERFSVIGLSLKRLYVWVLEPLQRLRLVHILLDTCKELRGGALISALSRYLDHGDPFVQEFILKLLPKVSLPYFETLFGWITGGELRDPFAEFLVKENKDFVDVWRSKYLLKMDMAPSFFDKQSIKRVIYFINPTRSF
jgi:gamma-tubulin complex component 3